VTAQAQVCAALLPRRIAANSETVDIAIKWASIDQRARTNRINECKSLLSVML